MYYVLGVDYILTYLIRARYVGRGEAGGAYAPPDFGSALTAHPPDFSDFQALQHACVLRTSVPKKELSNTYILAY